MACLRVIVAVLVLATVVVAGAAGAASSAVPPPPPTAVEPASEPQPPIDMAPIAFGTSGDYGKLHPCSVAFLSAMHDIGYTLNRLTVAWDNARPTYMLDRGLLDQAIPCEQARGIRVLLSIVPWRPWAIGGNTAAQAAFAAYAAQVAARYRSVRDFIIGNEPNQPRFWRPQFVGGQPASGRNYEATLAQAYDAIKAVRPDANVIGFSISSRGNDNPNASDNISRSPIWFIHDAAAAYRASGRTRPIMDEFDFHAYPNSNTNPYSKSLDWPHAGAADLDRIKQALWDGFHGTAQPTVAEQPDGRPTQAARVVPGSLPILIAEAGTQTDTGGHGGAYTGKENVPTVSQGTQAAYHVELMRMAACDPSLEGLMFYPLIDEPDLAKLQSGNLFADLAHKPSYDAVRNEIAAAQGRCARTPASWQHTEQVVGAAADFGGATDRTIRQKAWNFSVTADELATYTAALVSQRAPTEALLSTQGTVKAAYRPLVRFRLHTLKPGYYRYEIHLRSVVNPERTSLFVSRYFSVGT
jgi:hypothetical protein